jgi:bifunctional aspartokinase / homoserine dehydrogenase 1
MLELTTQSTAVRRRDTRLPVGIIGRGNVGGALLKLLPSSLRLVDAIDRRTSVNVLLGRLPEGGVLVDCSAAEGHEALYARALEHGVHVVTANKKPFASSQAAYDALFGHCAQLRYETTVGAGLPVIEPLKDLLRTGDEVRLIEGSFSGTLGFLCGELARGTKLSQAVCAAKELGYTEPHPGDDLGGLDVARKALILARECGLRLELEDVTLEPFVPEHLLGEIDVCRFIDSLSALDDALAERVRQQSAHGRVLRYLARIDVARRGVRVGPQWVDAQHPAAQLRGTESFVAYTTARYSDYPMRIQGPGAGAVVTAAGVLADLLAIARSRA